ncbi:phosphocholine cytidylyltransferase family protein [Alicyclobacillus hesperidum]|uniref:phosphocholine cytidylyltransferase family protein n=1 Tax=Alicyclobacillus hesperidum TaxID=89784 RepID=UPI0024E120A3|nr:phosphocholine cytidylyltransferase family protein [Alicyclobacillus hesperidum]
MKPIAVILAAGMSTRLRPLTEDRPKCLLKVGPKAILDWQLEALQSVGVSDLVVVVGYRKEMIQEHIRLHHPSFSVRFVENVAYEKTNTLFSLKEALLVLDGDFYYMNADVVYDKRILQRLQAGTDGGFLAIDKKQCRDEEVKVVVEHGRVAEIGKHLNPEHCEGEFIGVAKFTGDFARRFRQQVLDLAVPGNEMKFFEYALDAMADKSDMIPVDITGLPCVEIDFPEDYAFATEQVVRHLVDAEEDNAHV